MVQLNRDVQNEPPSETVPLLRDQLQEQLQHSETYDTSMDNEDAQSKYEEIRRELIKFSKRRFWWFCILGVVAIIAMHLSFLPRTSLSRDFRRWHGQHLTTSDVKRNYLLFSSIGDKYNDIPNEDYISWWLGNFTNINRKNEANLIGADSQELLSYVKNSFIRLGFETETYSYDVPELQRPLSLSIELIDSSGNSVYNASLFESSFSTPAYNGFGISGNVSGDYIYVNEGTHEDYQLLIKNMIDPKDKVVIAKSSPTSSLSTSEKLQTAQHYGAIGFIIYYDINDGLTRDKDKYLKLAIQRDTVGFNFFDSSKPKICPSIPSIPISYNAAKPILDTLDTTTANADFKHWPYKPAVKSKIFKLNLVTNFATENNRKLTNVVGTIKGIIKDSEIIIGAARDSFTNSSPLSSHAIMLDTMRNFRRLLKLGWKPLRTIRFVSWDGTHNGLLGSRSFTNDSDSFNVKQPVLCYINIDGDAVMGSRFKVDANPMFNHVLKRTSKFIPIPKNSTLFKTQPKYFNEYNDNDDEDNDYTTLHNYWSKQDNISINNLLGELIKSSDALVFQNFLGVPVINMKFENDPKVDPAVYVPNSNYYSYDWLIKQKVDSDLLLHGLLIRYLGLLTVSLSEHEVIDMKTVHYSEKLGSLFDQFTTESKSKIKHWSSKEVPFYLIDKFKIFSALKEDKQQEQITFSMLINKLHELIEDLKEQSLAIDEYNEEVAHQLFEDFAWYKLLKKLKIFAQFKLANYRLLHLESVLTLKDKDNQYLFDTKQKRFFNHVLFGIPHFSTRESNSYYSTRSKHSIFPFLYQSLKDDDFEMSVKWIVIIYEKLHEISSKIT